MAPSPVVIPNQNHIIPVVKAESGNKGYDSSIDRTEASEVKRSQTAPLWLEPKDGEPPFEEGALEAGFQIKSHHSPEPPGKFNGQFFTKSAPLYKIILFIFSLFNTFAENPSDHNKLSGCFCEKGGWTTTKLPSSFNAD